MDGVPPFNASTTAPAVRKPPTIPTRSPLRFFPSGGAGSLASGTAVLTCSDTAYPLSRIAGAKYIRGDDFMTGLSAYCAQQKFSWLSFMTAVAKGRRANGGPQPGGCSKQAWLRRARVG